MSTQKPKQREIWFGYDLHTAEGAVPGPKTLRFWLRKNPSQSMGEVKGNYGSETLMGLSYLLLNQALEIESPVEGDPQMLDASWRHLEPHFELYRRAQPRLKQFQKASETEQPAVKKFEAKLEQVLRKCCRTDHFDFTQLKPLHAAIEELENATKRPLIFNMNLNFSKEGVWQMHLLHSLLFHARGMVAGSFNEQLGDVTHQGVRVDSITDYLPKSEYVANDAMLYWEFKRQRDEMSEKAQEAMERAFWGFAHNGACLIESVPKNYLAHSTPEELEKGLYTAQMDWLLGTPAGLLFRIREETYGINEGYEKVFWHDHEASKKQKPGVITSQCHLSEKKVFQSSEVA